MGKDSKGYRKTRWSGLPNFECDDCPWSTLDEKEMTLHRAFAHNDPTAALEASEVEPLVEIPKETDK